MTELAKFSVELEEPSDSGQGLWVLRVGGEVDQTNADELQATLLGTATTAGATWSWTSTRSRFWVRPGLNALIAARELLRSRGPTIRLRRPSPQVRRTLELTGLESAFDLHG